MKQTYYGPISALGARDTVMSTNQMQNLRFTEKYFKA